jgi:hypothetical protein
MHSVSVENLKPRRNFLLNFLWFFLVDSYKNTRCSSVNLSMSDTKGILNNTKSYVNVTKEIQYNFLSLSPLTCSNSWQLMQWPQCCYQISSLYIFWLIIREGRKKINKWILGFTKTLFHSSGSSMKNTNIMFTTKPNLQPTKYLLVQSMGTSFTKNV